MNDAERTFSIDADIRKACTPPAWVYSDEAFYKLVCDRVLARSWQLVGDEQLARVPGQVHPFTWLEGSLNQPLLLSRTGDDELLCLSNVCTHRGTLVCEGPANLRGLRCRYHGRRFGLDGKFISMPEFEGVEGFPSPADDLARVALARWRGLLFAAIDPETSFERLIAPIEQRVGWMPIAAARLDASRSRDYLVAANWALYCENYLEGFHIPYVHPSLNDALDFSRYRTELFEHSSVQIGVARAGDAAFEPPAGSPDAGQRVAGYYFWLFPNLMLNFYPWGLSINLVHPLGAARTRVRFLAYVWDAGRLDQGAGGDLDRVEREDEAVVEAVQRGLASRLYARGRYSPTQERGTHHFHRLLAERTGAANERPATRTR